MAQQLQLRLAETAPPVPPELAQLFSLLNPHRPGLDETNRFDALFERFGIELRSSDETFRKQPEYVYALWSRLCEQYGSYIKGLTYASGKAITAIERWPLAHQGYIEAVILGNRKKAQGFATVLEVQNLARWAPVELGG